MYFSFSKVKPKRFCESGCNGTEKNAFERSITENHCSFGVTRFNIVCGFATTGGICSVISFIALRSWTRRYLPVLAFLTGKMGVLHVDFVVFTRIPAFSMSAITGLMPAFASALNGYCGFIGLCFVVAFTTATSASFIRPTSAGPVDHNELGSCLSSGYASELKMCHSGSPESVMCEAGCVVNGHPKV